MTGRKQKRRKPHKAHALRGRTAPRQQSCENAKVAKKYTEYPQKFAYYSEGIFTRRKGDFATAGRAK